MSCCLSIQGRIHVGEWGLRVITVRICSKGLPCGANGLPRGWLGSANVLPRDCLWIAWGLLRDPEIGPGIGKGLLCDYLGDAFGLPRACPGIGKGFMAESVWVFCRECVFSFRFDFASFISFATYNSICTSSICVFDFMFTRLTSVWGLARDCQGVMNRSNIRKHHGFRQRRFWICFAF